MKKEDVLFNKIYSRICGAGSYYDGLKVGKPEEFDMDIVIRLPIDYSEVVVSQLAVSHPIFQAFDILSFSIFDFTISSCYLLLLLHHQGLEHMT
jgi:cyclic GMP-AMP synthase